MISFNDSFLLQNNDSPTCDRFNDDRLFSLDVTFLVADDDPRVDPTERP